MEPEDMELRAALQELAAPVHEVPPLREIMVRAGRLRLRRRLERAGIAALVVALAAGGIAGGWWLSRELPSRIADQGPAVTRSVAHPPETYEPLDALPILTLETIEEIDLNGPGAAYAVLTPEADPGAVEAILEAYAQALLLSPPEGGATFPAAGPDVTMTFVPKSGEALYVGMHLVMSSTSLEVWTAGERNGAARRGWVGGDALHSQFRSYFALVLQYSLTTLPAVDRGDLSSVILRVGGRDEELDPARDAATVDAIISAYGGATLLPGASEVGYPAETQPDVLVTMLFRNSPAVLLAFFSAGEGGALEVWTGGEGVTGAPYRGRLEGSALHDLLRGLLDADQGP